MLLCKQDNVSAPSAQSYCVPNRNIHINLHLITDSIDYANQKELPLADIYLDQASAYDCAEHLYIYLQPLLET
jgi:hypothetical protein